jgi:putative flippase GtrA
MKKWEQVFTIMSILLIPVIGYVIMHALVYVLPVSASHSVQLLFSIIIIAMGLTVPYWMIKAGFHKAHLANPQESELELQDIPKEKQESKNIND